MPGPDSPVDPLETQADLAHWERRGVARQYTDGQMNFDQYARIELARPEPM
jgi:hypothetical protein